MNTLYDSYSFSQRQSLNQFDVTFLTNLNPQKIFIHEKQYTKSNTALQGVIDAVRANGLSGRTK